ncbi:hypothetical protein [Anditalea andensis]|uniref:hypothetical protein n=1 Tax=Anditalea andensis TaxID=1048983 RepID=UPI0013E03324|nr:hypothetical protein [Anditalea andensis]
MRSDEVTHHAEVQTFRKGGSTEVVDMAEIDTRIFTLPREVFGCREHLREVSRGHSSCRQRAVRATEVSLGSEGLNIGLRPNSIGSNFCGSLILSGQG